MKVKPPHDTDAPIQIGYGGVDFRPAKDGSWNVDDSVAEDLIRKGWVVVEAVEPAKPSAPAEPEA
jgi:hypothetical protein